MAKSNRTESQNIKLNIFGCEVTPTIAASDFYTFCQGGDAQTEGETPSEKSVDEKTKEQSENEGGIEAQESKKMVEPNRSTPDVNNQTAGGESDIDQALEDSRNNAPVQEGDLELL